jgi:PIN domain nuclease of toxin-antitoxin system
MKVLLDTHAFIWWDSDPTKLSPQARTACEDRTNVVLLSVASAWEMQIKLQLGKLDLRLPLAAASPASRHEARAFAHKGRINACRDKRSVESGSGSSADGP